MRKLLHLAWTAGLGLLAACGGARDARPAPLPPTADAPAATSPRAEAAVTTIALDPTAPVSSLRASLEMLARGARPADADCMLVWGDLGDVPPATPRARITWRDRQGLDAVLLCGDALEAKMHDPRLRQVAMLTWRDGGVVASHPSDTSEQTPIDPDDDALRREMVTQPTQGLFLPPTTGADASAPLGPVMDVLRRLPQLFLFVMLPVR